MRDRRIAPAALRRSAERMPLKWRLALVSFGLLAVMLAALGALVSFTQEQAMFQNQAVSLRQEARLALGAFGAGNSAPTQAPPPVGPFPNDAIQFVTNLAHQLTSPYTRAAIITTNGNVIVSDNQEPVTPAVAVPSAQAIQYAVTSAQPDTAYSITVDSTGERQLTVLLPLIDSRSQTTVALLDLSTPTAPIDRAVAATRLTLGVGILVALALAAALTIPLMNAALRPLVTMERVSRRIAAGELALRLEEPPTHDEIGRLARAFNSMVAQLEAAFARQKQFVGDVSHEMRTPLTALGGGLEMLLMGADRGDPAATRRLLRSQYAEVERMRRLVEDLLTLARLDEGHTVLRPETVEVTPLLNDIADEAERLTAGQELRREIAPDLPAVHADRDRLRQVLLALLDNAVKYTPAPGTITLLAQRAPSGGLRLDVRDTGMGIPPEALPHVFERFYRADPSRERATVHGGSGLGLAIAKSLVEAQGGSIAIESAPDAGTTVTIQFPPVPSAVRPAPAASTQPDDTSSAAVASQRAPERGT